VKLKTELLLMVGKEGLLLWENWVKARDKLKFIKEAEPPMPKDEVSLPEGHSEEDVTYIHTTIGQIKKLKDYLCIINKGKVIAKGEIPILFVKQAKDYCRNVAYELEGCYPFKETHIRRADKVIKALRKLGFTDEHKVAIFTLKKEEKRNLNNISFTQKKEEKVMPTIKSIDITYDDGARIKRTDPTAKTLQEIRATLKESMTITATQKAGTHIVYKREHFRGMPPEVVKALTLIDDFYKGRRIKANKPLEPTYLVVNEDEPYAEAVLTEIMIGETIKDQAEKVILETEEVEDEDKDSSNKDTEANDGLEPASEGDVSGQDIGKNEDKDASPTDDNTEREG